MWNKIKKFIIKNKKCIIYAFIFSLLVIPFIFIFISLNKSWADGMSVAALIYICLGFFIIILDISNFDTFNKLKKLFQIKKENNEKLTKYEKMQMKILNIDDEKQKISNKKISKFLSWYIIAYGIILLIISLPFIFLI